MPGILRLLWFACLMVMPVFLVGNEADTLIHLPADAAGTMAPDSGLIDEAEIPPYADAGSYDEAISPGDTAEVVPAIPGFSARNLLRGLLGMISLIVIAWVFRSAYHVPKFR